MRVDFQHPSVYLDTAMYSRSVSEIILNNEYELWEYYKACGLYPSRKRTFSSTFEYRRKVFYFGDVALSHSISATSWGFETQVGNDFYLLSFTSNGEAIWEMTKLGIARASDQICMIDGEKLVGGEFSGGSGTESILIDSKFLHNQMAALQGFACQNRIEFKVLPTGPKALRTWSMMRAVSKCLSELTEHNRETSAPFAISYLKQSLSTIILENLPHNYSLRELNQRSIILPSHLKKAVEYIHANAGRDILLSDIASAACTSIRNLQISFQRYKKTTPLRYLRQVRLALANEAINDISERRNWRNIASDLGFVDMRLFAKYYSFLYGKTPSQAQYESKGF